MDTELLIKELKKISDLLFKDKRYIDTGKINIAIDIIEELKDEKIIK